MGYFIVLLITYLQSVLRIELPDWLEFIKTVFPPVISYAGTQLVPYNLWLAYSRLWLKDGSIFFIFTFLGPLWALFFLKFYEVLASPAMGGIVVLSALTILAALEAMKHVRKRISSG